MQQATLLSPISGTVATVNLTVGQTVSGGASNTQLLVVRLGSFDLTTTVPDTSIGQVKAGDPVNVTPDGASQPRRGRVVSLGSLPTTAGTTSASVSYPVTIGFDAAPKGLFAGANADVSIVLASAANALTVPSSAIHRIGNLHLVTTLRNGKTSNPEVTIGAAGPGLTQITSGLTVGQQVVLADLHQPLPANNTTSGRGLGLGGGGRGGAAGGGTGTGAR